MVQGGSELAENTVVDLMVLATVVFVFGLVSRRLEGTVLTAPLVFVAAGVILGPAGLGLAEFGLGEHAVLLLGEIALAIVLFTDAAKINLPALRQNEELPLRLLGIGMPLTIALGTVIAVLVFTNLTFWEAAIVGTVLAPTDAALGQAVVSNPRVPVRVRQTLNVEAGLNDGLSVPFLALFLTLAVAEEELQPATYWIRFVLEQIGFGILVGVGVSLAGGWLVRQASRRGWMTESSQRLALLPLALIGWALADTVGGNGFIAAFVGGLVIGPTVERVWERSIRFTEAEGQLLRGGRTAAQPECVLRLWCPRVWSDPTLELAGCPVCCAELDVDPHASCCGFADRHEAERRLDAVYRLVRASGTSLAGVGADRGGGGSRACRAQPDRASGGANGAPQRALARGHRCALLAVYARRIEKMVPDAPEKRGLGVTTGSGEVGHSS